MASLMQLKTGFQRLLRPLVTTLASIGVTPNQVTGLTILLSAGVGALVALMPDRPGVLLLVPAWIVARLAFNTLDGMMARELELRTPLGALLNEVGDAVADAALFLPLALVPGLEARLVVGVVVLGLVSELAGLAALTVGAERRYDGPLAKPDRSAAFGIVALLVGLGLEPGLWTSILLFLLLPLSAWTTVNRMRHALRAA